MCAAQVNWDSALWDEAIWDQTVVTHTVTPSSTVGGTITPSAAQTVEDGASLSFSLTAQDGYALESVAGTCPGDLNGSMFSAGPIVEDCSVIVNFSATPLNDYVVTVSPGPNGNVSPAGAVTVTEQSTLSIEATADEGYFVQSWGGGTGGQVRN